MIFARANVVPKKRKKFGMIFAHFVVKISNKILTCKFKGSLYNADIESKGEKNECRKPETEHVHPVSVQR